MARIATIVLDGTEYIIHALNVGELEQVTEIFEGKRSKIAYAVIRLAMARAEPKVNGGIDTLEPTFEEINNAFQIIAELSGIPVNRPDRPSVPVAPALN